MVKWFCGSTETEIENSRVHRLRRLGALPPAQMGPLDFDQALNYARQKAQQQATAPEVTTAPSLGVPQPITTTMPGYPPGIQPPLYPAQYLPSHQQFPPASMYGSTGFVPPPSHLPPPHLPPPPMPPKLFNPGANAVAAAQQQSIYNNIVNLAAQNAQTTGVPLPVPPVVFWLSRITGQWALGTWVL